MSNADANFARWARFQLSTKEISRIILKLQDSTPCGTHVESWEKNQLNVSIEEIIRTVYTAAEMNARQFTGVQTYFAFFYIDKDGIILRSSFRIQGKKETHDFFSHYRNLDKILAYVVRYSDGTYLRSLNDEGTGYVRACAHRWLPCDLQAAEAVAKAFGAAVERIYAKARAK